MNVECRLSVVCVHVQTGISLDAYSNVLVLANPGNAGYLPRYIICTVCLHYYTSIKYTFSFILD